MPHAVFPGSLPASCQNSQYTGSSPSPIADEVLLDFEHPVRGRVLHVLERRPHVDPVLRVEQRAADGGDGEQHHDGRRVRRGVDAAESVDKRPPAVCRRRDGSTLSA